MYTFVHSFFPSSNEHLTNIYYMPGTMLSDSDSDIFKTCLNSLQSSLRL